MFEHTSGHWSNNILVLECLSECSSHYLSGGFCILKMSGVGLEYNWSITSDMLEDKCPDSWELICQCSKCMYYDWECAWHYLGILLFVLKQNITVLDHMLWHWSIDMLVLEMMLEKKCIRVRHLTWVRRDVYWRSCMLNSSMSELDFSIINHAPE